MLRLSFAGGATSIRSTIYGIPHKWSSVYTVYIYMWYIYLCMYEYMMVVYILYALLLLSVYNIMIIIKIFLCIIRSHNIISKAQKYN